MWALGYTNKSGNPWYYSLLTDVTHRCYNIQQPCTCTQHYAFFFTSCFEKSYLRTVFLKYSANCIKTQIHRRKQCHRKWSDQHAERRSWEVNVNDSAAVGWMCWFGGRCLQFTASLFFTVAKKHTTGLANVAAVVYFNIANDALASVLW